MSIRILLADDHAIFLDGLRHVLGKRADLEVIGEVGDGWKAVEAARRQAPDVVVMDVSMPGLNGVEATRMIAAERPETRLLCLSMHSESRFVVAALDAGAAGYLLKDCAREELVRAIRTVLRRQFYLSPGIAGTVVAHLKGRLADGDCPAVGHLTQRERSVLQLLAEGESTKEIGARLHLSVKTIGTHREHIMTKLDIHSIAGLTKFAIREGLISSER